ncbi:reverse transcriptase domain-containing protein [Alkalihalobacillus deserti]|uniref:reverse transcriptase domain-containing protein n=1 Tax=Alkalihalobacillus deserti TaxID=2879466 RepID=UPI001D14DDDB|nr:reverse transcriptase domain-containing protein [Alkalihalobacillus deserti]
MKNMSQARLELLKEEIYLRFLVTYLHQLDLELERRGHKFIRYADDCNIYVKSKRAGERVLKSITKFLEEELGLTVNQEKSEVGRPTKRKFLGFCITNEKWSTSPSEYQGEKTT